MLNAALRPLIAMLALGWASLAATAGAAPLPERTPPNGFTSINGAAMLLAWVVYVWLALTGKIVDR